MKKGVKAPGKPRRTAGRPRQEDAASIDRHILAVAFREFKKHGYGATSLSQIVSAARISKTTLYSRFPSKDVLFRAIMREQIDALTDHTLWEAKPDLGIEEGLRVFADRMLEIALMPNMQAVNRLILGESHRFPELGEAAVEKHQFGIYGVTQLLRELARLRGVPCKDPERAAEVFMNAIQGWYVTRLLTNREVSANDREQYAEDATRILRGMIGL
jgi:AcrR family transcriptional regulator